VNKARKIAFVTAMEREVMPLVKSWTATEREFAGRKFQFFELENENAVVVCGGIGAENARRATEAVIQLYQPARIVSAGVAGALDTKLKVGDVFVPRWVVDVRDGSRVNTGQGDGVLVSFSEVASVTQKAKLAQSYGAQGVDMEAAAVCKGAEVRGVTFAAIKAISDESNFAMPPMGKFITAEGQFKTVSFALHAAIRPWMWLRVIRLGRNTARAVQALCATIAKEIELESHAEHSALHSVSS
jgi:adenosylhomocysteine nucleosidase